LEKGNEDKNNNKESKKKLKNKGVFNIKPGMKVALTSPRK
jgi:hypothetical protein